MTCQSASALLGPMARDLGAFKKEKEEAILEAALKIIKDKGFHRARMSDIAKAANISYGLVYHYFKTKDDLFDAILSRWWESLFQLMKDIHKALARLKTHQVRLIHEEPLANAAGTLFAFIHPESANGVLVELYQEQSEEYE